MALRGLPGHPGVERRTAKLISGRPVPVLTGLKLLLPVSAGRRGLGFPFRKYKHLVYTWHWKMGWRLCPAWTLASWRQTFRSCIPMSRCCWSWSCSCSCTVFGTVSSCSLWLSVSWLEGSQGRSWGGLKSKPSFCWSSSSVLAPVSFLGRLLRPVKNSSFVGCSDTLLIPLVLKSPLLKSHLWNRYSGAWLFGSRTCIARGCRLVWGATAPPVQGSLRTC